MEDKPYNNSAPVSPDQVSIGPDPIEPGRHTGAYGDKASASDLRKNHSDLVLLFGILSLCACWPLGIAALLLGQSDLKSIRDGKMSRNKVGLIKTGMGLGFLGTALFAIFLVAALMALQRVPIKFQDMRNLFGHKPLPAHQIAYVGEWNGAKGTFIRIHPDGTGDFRTGASSMTGGLVTITGEKLAIGVMGLNKEWSIDQAPAFKNGLWSMELDGEVFIRRDQGVIADVTPQTRNRQAVYTGRSRTAPRIADDQGAWFSSG